MIPRSRRFAAALGSLALVLAVSAAPSAPAAGAQSPGSAATRASAGFAGFPGRPLRAVQGAFWYATATVTTGPQQRRVVLQQRRGTRWVTTPVAPVRHAAQVSFPVPARATGSFQYRLHAPAAGRSPALTSGVQQVTVVRNGSGAVRAGGTGSDRGVAVAAMPDGSTVIAAEITGPARFGSTTLGSAGAEVAVVARLSSRRTWAWAVPVPGVLAGHALAVDQAGGIYLAGAFSGSAAFGATTLTSRGGTDAFLASLAADGTWRWALGAGGTGDDGVAGVAAGSAGPVITGSGQATATFGTATLTAPRGLGFAAAATSEGAWRWATSLGEGSTGSAVAVDGGGSSVVTGTCAGEQALGGVTRSCTGDVASFVGKLSPEGSWLWSATASGAVVPRAVAVDHLGRIAVAGYVEDGQASFGDITVAEDAGMVASTFVAAMSPAGSWTWVQAMVTATDANTPTVDAAVDSAGAVLLTTSSALPGDDPAPGPPDFRVVKYSADGTRLWTAVPDQDSWLPTVATAVCPGLGDTPVVTGYFFGQAGFGDTWLVADGFAGTAATNDHGDVFVAFLTPGGGWQA